MGRARQGAADQAVPLRLVRAPCSRLVVPAVPVPAVPDPAVLVPAVPVPAVLVPAVPRKSLSVCEPVWAGGDTRRGTA